MELSGRKKAILSAIVKMYISSGEPVGSKMLCEILENAPSSATLRNEMSKLSEMGFLEQPHTSAGRVPTASGYRLYIESLMNKDEINAEHKRYIDESLSASDCNPEKITETAGKVLSDITGLPSIAADISSGGPRVKRVEILRMADRIAMMILITTDGRSRSRLVHTQSDLNADIISKFDRLVSQKILRRSIEDLTPAAQQNIYIAAGIDAFSLMPLLSSLFDMVTDIINTNVTLSGQSNLFSMGWHKTEADKIISLLQSRDTIKQLFSDKAAPLGVVFGKDTAYSALMPSSIIYAKYSAGQNNTGCIGVIGPTRMSYELIIPSIEYTAKKVDSLLSETFKDMGEF